VAAIIITTLIRGWAASGHSAAIAAGISVIRHGARTMRGRFTQTSEGDRWVRGEYTYI